MAFGIYTFTSKFVSLFSDNAATGSTYFLGEDLGTAINASSIKFRYYDKKPQLGTLYPAIWIYPVRKEEDFAQIGNSAKRNMTIDFEVVGIIQEGQGRLDGRNISDEKILLLSRNIENLLRNNIRLSQSSLVLKSMAVSTEYDVVDFNDTYNSICKHTVRVDVLST